MLTITLLGTGDAAGIPVHGCDDPPCFEARQMPWLKRRQTCILVQSAQTTLLLDMGNEAHMENLYKVPLDAVFITHLHQDHTAGLYALRWTKQPGGIPVYYPEGAASDDTLILTVKRGLTFHAMKRYQQVQIGDLTITAIPMNHGTTLAQGYVIESDGMTFALLTDTAALPEETVSWLANHKPELVLIDACFKPGADVSGHNTVDTAIETIQQLDVERGVLIHIAPHNWPYYELVPYVHEKDNGRTIVSYDGMILHLHPPNRNFS